MSFRSVILSLNQKLILLLIIFIVTSLRYDSINPPYLCIRCIHSLLSLTYTFIPDQDRLNLSSDYRAFEFILRLNLLVAEDPLLSLVEPLTIIKLCRSLSRLQFCIPKPLLCQVNKQVYNHNGHSVDAYWINYHQTNEQFNTKNILLYFHGGAYMVGDIHIYSGFECHLSRLFNVSVIHLEYRLAPEHPLPAAVDDAIALYNSLLQEEISSSQIILMGDSAGGGLALLTIQSLISRKMPIPRGVVVLSPWTDLSSSGQSYICNRLSDIVVRHGVLHSAIKLVLGDNHQEKNRYDPLFSPIFGSFNGFPSMYINVGTAELLADDSRKIVEKAKQAQVDVTFEEGIHLAHVYPLLYPYYPEARNTLRNIQQWINNKYQK